MLAFLLGLLIGGSVGVFVVCLCVVARGLQPNPVEKARIWSQGWQQGFKDASERRSFPFFSYDFGSMRVVLEPSHLLTITLQLGGHALWVGPASTMGGRVLLERLELHGQPMPEDEPRFRSIETIQIEKLIRETGGTP